MPKVSIIVPIYKTEQYINRCVDSILSQTFSDIEVILVDDGSPDKCPEICDEAAEKDKRIKVIHKENGGLSSARNAGTAYANGEFIFYLDGDDYLEKNAVEHLLEIQKAYNADVVVGNYTYTYSDHEDAAATCYPDLKILNRSEAMGLLMEGKIQTFAWGKLIRSDIAKKENFPEGKLFEDHFWTHLIFQNSRSFICTKSVVVHYMQRNNSISYTFNISRLDIVEGWKTRIEFLENQYPELVNNYKKRCAEDCCVLAWLITVQMKHDKKQGFKILQKFIQEYQLENYCDGKNKKLLVTLKRNYTFYMIKAIFYRIVRF